MSILGSSSLRLHCGPRARLRTFAYYSTGTGDIDDSDVLLGDAIIETCVSFDEPCGRPGCGARRGLHERRWLHNGLRVVADVQALEIGHMDSEGIELWEACSECGETTSKRRMSDGAS